LQSQKLQRPGHFLWQPASEIRSRIDGTVAGATRNGCFLAADYCKSAAVKPPLYGYTTILQPLRRYSAHREPSSTLATRKRRLLHYLPTGRLHSHAFALAVGR